MGLTHRCKSSTLTLICIDFDQFLHSETHLFVYSNTEMETSEQKDFIYRVSQEERSVISEVIVQSF
jgi:hypothetical protein